MRPLRIIANHKSRQPVGRSRHGAALVELAHLTPVVLMLVMGVVEMGTALRASTILTSACREAGRLVAMDWRYIVQENQTPNDKVALDLKNFVTAAGLKGADTTVTITHADGENAGQTFDLSDPDNDLQLVKIEVSLPYSSISLFPVNYMQNSTIKAKLVMRATTKGGSLTN